MNEIPHRTSTYCQDDCMSKFLISCSSLEGQCAHKPTSIFICGQGHPVRVKHDVS